MGRAYEVRKASMAKTSAAKAKIYSRFGKEIYIAAKAGVPDAEMNVGLKRIIEKAKANQVPTDVINRAIEKAKGGSGENYVFSRYEGFGPNGSTVIVDCLTDNANRTYSEVRNCFVKSDGKIGVEGSVSFTYDNLGVLSFKSGITEDAILEVLFNHECDVTDVEIEDAEITVYVVPTDLYKAKEALEKDLQIEDFTILEISMLPTSYVTLSSDDDKKNFKKLLEMLDDVDDVQEVYHNVTAE